MTTILILTAVLVLVLFRICYLRAQQNRHRLYKAALDNMKAGYEAELQVQEKVHRKYELIFYVAGICVGALVLWLALKLRE
jgi:hypothetical protein